MHRILFALLPLGALAACAGQQEPANSASDIWFACDSGAAFTAQRSGDFMVVTTKEGQYELAPRPSSIGQKFASQDTVLIIDDEAAVLTGAPGRGYNRCSQVDGPVVDRELAGI